MSIYDLNPDQFESQVARQLLGRRRRGSFAMKFVPVMIALMETAVCFARVFTEESEDSFSDRLARVPTSHLDALAEFLPSNDDGSFDSWLQRMMTPSGQRFLEKALGSAFVQQFRSALEADFVVLVPAAQLGINAALPVIHAYDVCLRVTRPNEGPSVGLVAFALTVDRALSNLAERDYRLVHGPPLRPQPNEMWSDILSRSGFVSIEVSRQMAEYVEGIGTPLLRKLRGAGEVLETSSDGVSQAAHSLVEFLDRVLRFAFPDEEVVNWAESWPVKTDQLNRPDGRGPTKRCQALCLASAGSRLEAEEVVVVQLVADTLVWVRSQLQELKHADSELDSERSRLRKVMEALEAGFLLMFRLAWMNIPEDRLGRISGRLKNVA